MTLRLNELKLGKIGGLSFQVVKSFDALKITRKVILTEGLLRNIFLVVIFQKCVKIMENSTSSTWKSAFSGYSCI